MKKKIKIEMKVFEKFALFVLWGVNCDFEYSWIVAQFYPVSQKIRYEL